MARDPAFQQFVGAEMERIFGPAKPARATQELEDAPWASPRSPTRPQPRRRFLRRTALSVLAILVLAIGLLTVRAGVRQRPAASRNPAMMPTPPVTRRAAPPTPAAAVGRPAEPHDIADRPPATVAEERTPAVHAPSSPRPSAMPPAPRVIAPRVIAPRRAAPALAAAPTHPDPKPAAPSRPPAASRRSPTEQAETACAPDEGRDVCIYRDITAADRRLRRAYARALRDRAPVRELAAVRQEWQKARNISLKKPDETLRRYNRLTGELQRLDAAAAN